MEYSDEYFDRFEENLRVELLRICTDKGVLDGKLLASDDITDYYTSIEAYYLADAVQEVIAYPTVSVGWAAYLGMGVAWRWDKDWKTYARAPYKSMYGSQGFDNMDDHVVFDLLGLQAASSDAKSLTSNIQSCAQATISAIRREQFEPQSKMAYHAFIRACRAMYAIGAAIELRRLGYIMELMPITPMAKS